jgi:hypothetical protein
MRFIGTRLTLVALALTILPALLRAQKSPVCTTLRTPAVCPNAAKAPGQPCSDLPHDVNFKQLENGYSTLIPVCQQPFDDFSWQSFVALNWPLTDLSQPRPWEQYPDPDSIFNGAQLRKMRQTTAAEAKLTAAQAAKVKIIYKMAKQHALPGETFEQFLQATQEPLIDRNLNFALFEEKVNDVWAGYVVKGSCAGPNPNSCLNTLAGQQAFVNAKKQVNFPVGFYLDDATGRGGRIGAMELKAAWRILDPAKGDDPKRYYTRVADIYMDQDHTVNHQPLVIKNVLVGLVGFHINTYVKDGKGSVWSTFEQEDNAPPQGNAAPGQTYSFYNGSCPAGTCPLNTAPQLIGKETNYLWGATAPYAQRYAYDGKYGTQVTIVNPFYPETEATNDRWHKLMANTVWVHYRLIGSQWVNGEIPGHAGIPPLLANSVQETYVPQSKSSCITCHGDFAKLKTNPQADADLSFLLSHAH